MSEPNETPQSENHGHDRIVERLTVLTARGEVAWRRLYDPREAYDLDGAERTTDVLAYAAEDEEYGRILLRLPDPAYDDAPDQFVLTISGERAEASQADLGILHDSVVVYFRDVMAGFAEPPGDVVDEVLDHVHEQHYQQKQAYTAMIDRIMGQVESQMGIISHALTAVTNAQDLHNKTLTRGETSGESLESYVPLSAEAVGAVLYLYAGRLGLPDDTYPTDDDVAAIFNQIYGSNE